MTTTTARGALQARKATGTGTGKGNAAPRSRRRPRSDLRVALFFIAPALLGFVAFYLVPSIRGVYLSFTEYSVLGDPTWIGTKNYTAIFADDLFWNAMAVTVQYVALNIGFQTAIAGTTGEMTIATSCGIIGTITGTTIGTIPTIGTTTIGGIVITGTIRIIPISIIGGTPRGQRSLDGSVTVGSSRCTTTMATTCTTTAVRCTTEISRLRVRKITRNKRRRSRSSNLQWRPRLRTGCRWVCSR